MKINLSLIDKGIEKYGKEAQCILTIEELAELSQAIAKMFRADGANRENLIEEMADVLICMEYLKSIFEIRNRDLNIAIKVKQKRQKGRLKQ